MLDSVREPAGMLVSVVACHVGHTSCGLDTAGASREVLGMLRRFEAYTAQQVHSAAICVAQHAGATQLLSFRAPGGAQVVAGVEDEAAAAHQTADLVHQLRGLVLLERACQHPKRMHSGSKPCLTF